MRSTQWPYVVAWTNEDGTGVDVRWCLSLDAAELIAKKHEHSSICEVIESPYSSDVFHDVPNLGDSND